MVRTGADFTVHFIIKPFIFVIYSMPTQRQIIYIKKYDQPFSSVEVGLPV